MAGQLGFEGLLAKVSAAQFGRNWFQDILKSIEFHD